MGYQFLEPGEISIHDDRWLTHPWGVNGGLPGQRSDKLMVRADGSEQWMVSKCDRIAVAPGDTLYFNTWGGGGWGDPLERDAEQVALDTKARPRHPGRRAALRRGADRGPERRRARNRRPAQPNGVGTRRCRSVQYRRHGRGAESALQGRHHPRPAPPARLPEMDAGPADASWPRSRGRAFDKLRAGFRYAPPFDTPPPAATQGEGEDC